MQPDVSMSSVSAATHTANQLVITCLRKSGQELNLLPPLATHHVVLGRYLGSKTKPLNEATRIYRDVRKTTKRTKHFLANEIAALKQFVTKRVRTELKNPNLPDVIFVVDIHKTEDAGKLEELLGIHSANNHYNLVRNWVEDCQEEAIFIHDSNDFFLKADLDSKKRPGRASQVPSDGSSSKKRKQNNCSTPSVITTTTTKTDTSSLSDRTPSYASVSLSSKSLPNLSPELFQLKPSNGILSLDELEEQAHQICDDWLRQDDHAGLEATLRKASLVQSMQKHCTHYKRRFQHNPFRDSPISALRQLNEEHFVAILNTLGNCMIDWYHRFPSTCLEDEANAWTGMLPREEEPPSATSNSAMEQGSIGTYSSLELELPSTLCTDDGVSDIVQCFEEFSMGSSTRSGQPTHNEWSPVVREQEDTANPLPPRWDKSRHLFQKRQQGHQFLQKQLRRFRNKKTSSSSKKTKPVATVREGTVRVSTKEELSLLYRRLRHNDPTLKEAIVDFAIAQQEAKGLIRVLGLSFYDWDMRRCTEDGGDAFLVLTRSESSDWEDSNK